MYFKYFVSLILFFSSLSAADISIPASLSFEVQAKAGEKITHFIPIMNKRDEIVTVKITHVDYLFNSKGENFYKKIGTNKRSNGKWISRVPTYLKIAPKEIVKMPFEINIPKRKGLAGTYWSMLLIEPQKVDIKADKNQIAIQTILRYGYQIITNIGKSKKHNVKILKKELVKEKGKNIFVIDIENRGIEVFIPMAWIKLFDDNGKEIGHFKGNKSRIYPKCSSRFKIDLSKVKSGKYHALIAFDDEKNSVIGTQYEMDL